MITSAQLYWLLKLDDIQSALHAVSIWSGIISCVLLILAVLLIDDLCKDDANTFKRILKTACVVFFVSSLIAVFTPTTKQAAVIYAAPAVLGSEFVSETMPREAKELYGLAKEWLTEKANGVEK